MDKLKQFWKELDGAAVYHKREVFLGGLLCLMTGLTVGMLISPKKSTCIGCNNTSICEPEEVYEDEEE